MIKAVIFDWGNVLIANKEPERLKFCSDALGTTPDILKPIHNRYLPLLDTGTIDEETFWFKVQQELGVNKPKVLRIWKKALEINYEPFTKTWELANILKENGYKLALLSNCERPVTKLSAKKEYEIFALKIFSCFEGVRKPDRKIYENTLEKLNVKPEEAIFIDDREDYIEGAKVVGLRAILFQSPGQLEEELAAHGVRVNS